MKLIEFIDRFPNEESCEQHFKEEREKAGVTCKRCSGKQHYWMAKKKLYKCKSCYFMMSLKSGTVMENSKLPYRFWLITLHLLTSTKKTISALELQRQLGHKYYEPIWAMVHKVRLVLGKRDSKYKLDENVEIDEAFYSVGYSLDTDSFTGEKEELKRGKGSQKKAKVMVMVSYKKLPKNLKNTNNIDSIPKYIKMKLIENLESKTINKEVKDTVNPTSIVVTDGYSSFTDFENIFKKHISYNMGKYESEKVLPWVHKAITNSKNLIKAMHHGVRSEYLQNYLDEFCFKFNRRYFGEKVFDRSVIAAVTNVWY